jgi:hypothetical protein
MSQRIAQVSAFSAALINVLIALALFFSPEWFFEHIGHFPPYNRHYMGDTAAFLIGPALALLIAARDPARYRLLIGGLALASVIHIANHGYDAAHGLFNTGFVADFAPLILLSAALILPLWAKKQEEEH